MSGPYCESCVHYQTYPIAKGQGECTDPAKAIMGATGERVNLPFDVSYIYSCINHKAEEVVSIGPTLLDISPDQILENNKGIFESLVLMGYGEETGKFILASSRADLRQILWLAEEVKRVIFEVYES